MTAEEVTTKPGDDANGAADQGGPGADARDRADDREDGLDRNQADAKTREMVWVAAYWAMGLICDLDEAHRALGDVLPHIQNAKHYMDAKGQAFLEAYSSAQQEGRRQAGRDLVLRQATRRFGPDADAAAAIASIVGAGRSRSARGARPDRRRLAVAAGEVLTTPSSLS